MKEIKGETMNISNLLGDEGGTRFKIDYYQREYSWEKKQVEDLIEDLTEKFLEYHEKGRKLGEVEQYGHYFLGSIILSEKDEDKDKDEKKYIIDGQQRLTSVTLLLICLYHELDKDQQLDNEQKEHLKEQLAKLFFYRKNGNRFFNLDEPERAACMHALVDKIDFNEDGKPKSAVNIWGIIYLIVLKSSRPR